MAYNGSINLLKYPGAKKIIANGQKGIFIPTDDNPTIYVGGKGAYASIRIVEKESTFDDRHYTHFVAASLSKGQREELQKKGKTDEEIKAFSPILGNLETYTAQPSGDSFEAATVTAQDIDDLPF